MNHPNNNILWKKKSLLKLKKNSSLKIFKYGGAHLHAMLRRVHSTPIDLIIKLLPDSLSIILSLLILCE